MNSLKVVMLGDGLSVQGGISSVEKLILSNASPDVQIRHISTREDGFIGRKLVVFGQALTEFLRTLLRKEVDVFHIHLSERGSAFRKAIFTLIALGFSKPVIMHAHGSEFHVFYSRLPLLVKQGLSWVFHQCFSFIVLSESWKSLYASDLELKPGQIVVLPNPIKLPQTVPHRTGSTKVSLVFLGRIGQRKGAFDLIKAFAALPLEQKTCSELTLAGDGDVEAARRLVKDLNLTTYISILDWVGPDQRDTLLAKANVFVLPSYNEGLPMALLEAMGWGLPVITTPVGGIPEVVIQAKNGLLVDPGNVQQLSEAMQALIKSESLRLSLGRAARVQVTPLDVKNYSYSLSCIYRSTLESKEALL